MEVEESAGLVAGSSESDDVSSGLVAGCSSLGGVPSGHGFGDVFY